MSCHFCRLFSPIFTKERCITRNNINSDVSTDRCKWYTLENIQSMYILAIIVACLRVILTLKDNGCFFIFVISNQFAGNFSVAIAWRKPALARKSYFFSSFRIQNCYLFWQERERQNFVSTDLLFIIVSFFVDNVALALAFAITLMTG